MLKLYKGSYDKCVETLFQKVVTLLFILILLTNATGTLTEEAMKPYTIYSWTHILEFARSGNLEATMTGEQRIINLHR